MTLLLPWTHPLYGITALLLGAAIGSFLNVAIYRLPRGLSVNVPKRSFCPVCKKPIPMWRNIPLVTWLLQRGKCAECDCSIPVRYFIVELLTALVWGGSWLYFDDPSVAIFFMLLSSIFIVISAIDIELMVIPRQLTISGSILGLSMAAWHPEFFGETEWTRGLLKSCFGFAIGWVSLWLVVLLGKLAFGKQSYVYEKQTAWMLKEPESDEEELCFVFGEEVIGWSDIFYRKTDKLLIDDLKFVRVDGVEVKADLVEICNNQVKVDGEVYSIEKLRSLDGEARRAIVPREAMGMGDVDLLGMLGACLGPASLLLTIFAACMVSIGWAGFNSLGFCKEMQVGP
ncbi:MAG: prepilin peptidase, partial [Rubritalea sp.]|uniref:prepilin peptidase n=1 Tax=Rubritalea sp. TaxID=2109375 RepID=UPI0032423B86